MTGADLRAYRVYAGFAVKDFARLLGVTPEHLSRVEHGRARMSVAMAKLARAVLVAKAGALDELAGVLLEEAK